MAGPRCDSVVGPSPTGFHGRGGYGGQVSRSQATVTGPIRHERVAVEAPDGLAMRDPPIHPSP
jgi:hypothetical protein